ncbi:MAG: hypothetical protein ACLFR1_00360 [Spirochaetia bacterium]
MYYQEFFIVYPEGEMQEITHRLSFGDIVDLNGRPLTGPLPSARMIAYKVNKIRKSENKGNTQHFFYLELLNIYELAAEDSERRM